jgi:hypothetical protein
VVVLVQQYECIWELHTEKTVKMVNFVLGVLYYNKIIVFFKMKAKLRIWVLFVFVF